MKIQQIRNATIVVKFAGKKILVDPMLSAKGALPTTFIPAKNWSFKRNPLEDLPISKLEIIKDLDFVFLSHLHFDHWDKEAAESLPRGIKIFVQDQHDKSKIENFGFTDVEILSENSNFGEIRLSRTKAQHGKGFMLRLAGYVSGIVLKHPTEKTLYIAADTVWYEGVQEALAYHQPEVVILNGGDNQFFFGGQLVMNKIDILQVQQAIPNATILVSHMEGVNHHTLKRQELKTFLIEKQIADRVHVPEDGQSYTF